MRVSGELNWQCQAATTVKILLRKKMEQKFPSGILNKLNMW